MQVASDSPEETVFDKKHVFSKQSANNPTNSSTNVANKSHNLAISLDDLIELTKEQEKIIGELLVQLVLFQVINFVFSPNEILTQISPI